MKKQLLIVSCLSLTLAGCSVAQKATQQVVEKAQETAVEQAVKANCTYEKDVCDFLASQSKSFQKAVTINGTISGGTLTETKMDGQGNMQAITKQNGKEISNMIILNNATYMKDYEDNQWFKMSDGNESDKSLFNMKEMIEDMKDTFAEDNTGLVVKKLGEEACDNLTCVKYEMIDQDLEGSKTVVWVDTKEKLARKMETGTAGSTITMTYAYGPVTISQPSPVKEFTVPDVPGLQNGQMPSMDDIQNMMKDLPQMGNEGE